MRGRTWPAVAFVALVAGAAVLLARGGCGGPESQGAPDAATRAAAATAAPEGTVAGPVSRRTQRAASAASADDAAEPEDSLRGLVRLREGGAPVARATVRLRRGRSPPAVDEGLDDARTLVDLAAIGRPFAAETVTGADGRFSFGRAPEGTWRVVARGEGTSVGACTGSGPSDVTIDLDAARPTRVRFEDRVTDAPVPRAEVLVWSGRIEGPPDERLVADDDARLTLHVARGVTVLVQAEGYCTKVLSSLWGHGDVLCLMDAASALTGLVLLPDGSPAVGADVRLHDPGEASNLPPAPVLRTVTGLDGRFRLPGIDEGASVLTIDVAGFPRIRTHVSRAETELTVRLEEPASVVVCVVDATGAPFDDVSVWSGVGHDEIPGARLEPGRFRVGPLHPGIVRLRAKPFDPDRHAAASAVVALRPGERRRDIRMVVAERAPVTLRVRLRLGERFTAGEVRARSEDGRETTATIDERDFGAPLRLRPGESVEVAAALLHEDDLVPGPPVTAVAGSAASPATVDLPVHQGRKVIILFVDGESGRALGRGTPFHTSGTGVAEREWEREFAVLDDARFRLRAEVEGFLPYDAEHTAADVVDGNLTVPLSRGAVVSGRIVGDVPRGTELTVEARLDSGPGAGGSSFGDVAADGAFHLSGLGEGSGELRVYLDGVQVHSVPLRVGTGGATLDGIRLPALRSLRGRVVDARGRSVLRAAVVARGGSIRWESHSGPDGEFEILLPATASVVLRAESGDEIARPVTAPPSTDDVRIVLEPRTRILFRLPWTVGEEVRVVVRDPRGATEWESGDFRAGGIAYRIVDLPPGSWDVVFVRAKGERVVRVDAAPGEVREIVVGD